MEGKGTATATATGCYKCGRPGHWARDCPFSAPNQNPNSATSEQPPPRSAAGGPKSAAFTPAASSKSAEKPKKLPRTRPKLTPDLLLSDDGLGYILRYFPREFKYRGRGHEVRDLGNLLQLYSDWHSRLLPYYPFNQFVHKVEKVAATRRVKLCLGELRERVANGGDPTKLREPPVVEDIPADKQENEETSHQEGDVFAESLNVNDIEEDMLNNIYDKATEEPSQSMHNVIDSSTASKSIATQETSKELPNNGASQSNKAEITEEQRARMEANRLKALERRAARAALSQASQAS